MRRQLAIILKYCYSSRRATQNMSASRNLPTVDLCVEEVLSVFIWKKVHLGDAPLNFSRLILVQINQLRLLQKIVYLDRHCSFETIQIYLPVMRGVGPLECWCLHLLWVVDHLIFDKKKVPTTWKPLVQSKFWVYKLNQPTWMCCKKIPPER